MKKMSSKSENLKSNFNKLNADIIVPYDVALEKLNLFAKKYTRNEVYNSIQAKNHKRNRKDYPSVEEAEKTLSNLSQKIQKNIGYLAKTLQNKN